MYVCLKTIHCALDKGCVYKITFSYRKLMYPAFNVPSGSIRQRLVQAHSTGTTTIMTAANSAIFLLVLCPFPGTAFLFAWLPASSQAASWLPVGLQAYTEHLLGFSLYPLSGSDGTFGNTSIRASLCCRSTLRQPGGLGRGKGRRHELWLRSHPWRSYEPKQWER